MTIKWNKETTKAAENKEGALELLSLGISKRAEAKNLEDEIEHIKKEGNEYVEAALKMLGLTKAKADGIGSVSIVNKKRTTTNPTLVSEYLLSHGVSSTLTKEAIAAGKKESSFSYVDFRKAKK